MAGGSNQRYGTKYGGARFVEAAKAPPSIESSTRLALAPGLTKLSGYGRCCSSVCLPAESAVPVCSTADAATAFSNVNTALSGVANEFINICDFVLLNIVAETSKYFVKISENVLENGYDRNRRPHFYYNG